MKQFGILATTDLHGLYYNGQQTPRPDVGSLARVREFVSSYPMPHLLLDAGDFMGGGLPAYAANHLLTRSPNLPALLANEAGYDAMAPGNHDLDAGPEAFSQYGATLTAPLLAANLRGVDNVKPWTLIRADGWLIAVIGLVTPECALAGWQGAEIADPLESIRSVLASLRASATPDLTVGLFHLGPQECAEIAAQTVGIDLIVSGHVHSNPGVTSAAGTTIINPGAYGRKIAEFIVTHTPEGFDVKGNILILPAATPPDMPSEISCIGRRCLTSTPATLHQLLRQAYLKAFPSSVPMIASDDIALPAGFTLADSFRLLPYDDYLLLLPDGTSLTPHDLGTPIPPGTICSPHPLRHYL
ncbi:MAG: metallophosphoesterase [Muribaculaceae bacterium]|nr:metallophosphoesterase [Muribaculaceae bacterium]